MAWNPKTIAGKLLKGAVSAGGTVLGIASGAGALGVAAKAAGAVVSKGTTILAKATGVLNNIKVKSDKVVESAKNLQAGYTKEVNALNNAAKDQLKSQVAYATGETPYINEQGLEDVKKPFNFEELIKNPAVKYGALALVALLILPKIFKR